MMTTGERALGTSPRVRGKRSEPGHPLLYRGYIPACAGEAVRTAVPKSTSGVHPRVCGGSHVFLSIRKAS